MEIKGCLNQRRGYEKVDGSGCRKRKIGSTEVAAEAAKQKRRRSWGMTQRLDKLVSMCEAKKFFIGLRDAYVDFMLRNADVRVLGEGIGGGYVGATDDEFGIGRVKALKEDDEKMIMEMYQ